MSIRTKLLAVIVGLNGAILILAHFLFLRAEPQRQSDVVARAALARLAADVPREGELEQTIEAQLAGGVWEQVFVVVAASTPGASRPHPLEIHRAAAWFQRDRRGASDPPPTRLKEQLATIHGQVLRRGPVLGYDTGILAFVPAHETKPPRPYSIVALPATSRFEARTLYLVMIGGVILLTAVSAWLVSRFVTDPLGRLAQGASRIAEGDYAVRLERSGAGDEIDRTISAFNRMAEEVAEYQGQLESRVLDALGRIKRAEQHLAIAQRLAATGKLAAGLAHEINNPLGGLKNAVRALMRGDLGEAQMPVYLELIDDGLGRIEQTVKRFLSFTPRSVEPRPADLREVVERALGLASHQLGKRSIEIGWAGAATPGATVFGDAHELQQVVLNLLLNAADAVATDGSGRIGIELAGGPDEVVLEIRDNGQGMSPEDQDRCFDMFFTTKDVGEGTGLGLAVVHNIVTNHGGRIEVESTIGEGTTFRIHLPADGGEEAAPGASAPGRIGAPATPRTTS